MLEKGSKQQRDVARLTAKLKADVAKLIHAYEAEVGIEAVKFSFWRNGTVDEMLVEIVTPTFKDEEEE